jgi:hypothetical protein
MSITGQQRQEAAQKQVFGSVGPWALLSQPFVIPYSLIVLETRRS